MKTTTLILSAIVAVLPAAVNATQTIVETNTPAAVGSNGTVKRAFAPAPYVTNEPTQDDQTHIATTAYVKGAYNDAIAAVNSLDVAKQNFLYNGYTEDRISSEVVNNIDFLDYLADGPLPQGMDNTLISVQAVADGIDYKINQKRVRIYTTWDDDTAAATTLVPFETAQ